MDRPRHIVIVGATSAIARHCAQHWLQTEPLRLTLVARDPARLERLIADMRLRSPHATIEGLVSDFQAPAQIQSTVEAIAQHTAVDTVLIAHGSLPDQLQCQQDLQAVRDALEVNALSPALFAEAFAAHLARQQHGTLALTGSVAGDRGRRSNYVYGASKGLLERYAEGLQHRFAGTAVRVVLLKPGPTDTPMTAHLKAQGIPLADVRQVAQQMVAAIDSARPVAYAPHRWRWIMWCIRKLPRSVFNKLKI